jgi:hypothetical protein
MAQSISLISGSPFAGCPIVYSVQPAAYDGDRTFHRIIVRVYAKLENDDDYTTFDFSNPVETKPDGQSFVTVASTFDISSALVAVADKYEYDANPTFPKRYPYIKFRVEAWDEWMIDGVVSTNQNVVYWPSAPTTISGTTYDFYGYAFMGAFNDLERMGTLIDGNGVEYLNITYLSRKPNTSPEFVYKSTPFIYPSTFASPGRSLGTTDAMSDDSTPVFVSGAPTDGPKSLSHTPSAVGSATVGGHVIYAVDKPTNGYELRFVNGMGCLESINVTSFVKKEANIHTEKYTIARRETLKKFSRTMTVKNDDKDAWTLVSGPLDEAWASWYIHEFLKAQLVWIKVGSQWIQCHVMPEETETIIDQEKAQPMKVQFKIELDLVY